LLFNSVHSFRTAYQIRRRQGREELTKKEERRKKERKKGATRLDQDVS
jgi:hypothetical protein